MSSPYSICPIGLDDVPGLTAIHIAAFGNRHNARSEVRDHYRKIFDFVGQAPVESDRKLSLGAFKDGRLVGHVVGVPIYMQCNGQPITASVATLLAMHPEERNALVSRRLLRELFSAPVAYTYADRVNNLGRRSAATAGMEFFPHYSLRWARVLRVGTALRGAVGNRRTVGKIEDRVLRLGTSAIEHTVDRIAASRLALPKMRGGSYERRELQAIDVVASEAELLADFTIRPDYSTPARADHQWNAVQTLRPEGTHLRRGVWSAGGNLLGWYAMHIWPSGTGEVTQLVAAQGAAKLVVAAMFDHAVELKVGSLHGRSSPNLQVALGDAGAIFHSQGAWCGVQSSQDAVNEAFRRSTALCTALEGEYPLMLGRS